MNDATEQGASRAVELPEGTDSSRRPLAFVTMARGDHETLDLWVRHHAGLAGGRASLTVISHGADPEHDRIAAGCSRIVLPYDPAGVDFEPRRIALLHGLVAGLLGYYRHVAVLDCDELLTPAPELDLPLADFLDWTDFQGVAVSPTGFDLTQRPSSEPEPLDFTRPILRQRRYGYLHGEYSKPCIFRAPPRRGGNQHALVGEPWQIEPLIALIHLRFADRTHGERTGRSRIAQLDAYDAAGSEHRIGNWDNRLRQMVRVQDRLDASDCPDLTPEERVAFAARMRRLYERFHRKMPWKESRGAPRRLPDDWLDLI